MDLKIKYLLFASTLILVIKLSAASRMEVAEKYIEQLEKSTSDDEAERLMKSVIEVLSPIAESDPNFNNLRYTAYSIIEEGLKEIESHRNAGSDASDRKRKRINFSAFLEIFQLFKISFKYETVTEYNLKSDEL
jgi:hypothetical protein